MWMCASVQERPSINRILCLSYIQGAIKHLLHPHNWKKEFPAWSGHAKPTHPPVSKLDPSSISAPIPEEDDEQCKSQNAAYYSSPSFSSSGECAVSSCASQPSTALASPPSSARSLALPLCPPSPASASGAPPSVLEVCYGSAGREQRVWDMEWTSDGVWIGQGTIMMQQQQQQEEEQQNQQQQQQREDQRQDTQTTEKIEEEEEQKNEEDEDDDDDDVGQLYEELTKICLWSIAENVMKELRKPQSQLQQHQHQQQQQPRNTTSRLFRISPLHRLEQLRDELEKMIGHIIKLKQQQQQPDDMQELPGCSSSTPQTMHNNKNDGRQVFLTVYRKARAWAFAEDEVMKKKQPATSSASASSHDKQRTSSQFNKVAAVRMQKRKEMADVIKEVCRNSNETMAMMMMNQQPQSTKATAGGAGASQQQDKTSHSSPLLQSSAASSSTMNEKKVLFLCDEAMALEKWVRGR